MATSEADLRNPGPAAARKPAATYDPPVANVGVAILAIASIVGLIVLALRVAPGQQRSRTRALLGVTPGLIGAGIIGATAADLVPDSFESFALPWVVVAVTIGMVALTLRNLERH